MTMMTFSASRRATFLYRLASVVSLLFLSLGSFAQTSYTTSFTGCASNPCGIWLVSGGTGAVIATTGGTGFSPCNTSSASTNLGAGGSGSLESTGALVTSNGQLGTFTFSYKCIRANGNNAATGNNTFTIQRGAAAGGPWTTVGSFTNVASATCQSAGNFTWTPANGTGVFVKILLANTANNVWMTIDDISFSQPVAPSCTAPTIGTVTNTTNCAAGTFSVVVPINSLGSATSVNITASPGPTCGTCTNITSTGSRTLTFPVGTPQTITVVHNLDAACNVALGSFSSTPEVDGVCHANNVFHINDNACTDVPFCVNSSATQLGTDVFVQSIDLVVRHTWIADMTIQLISPGGVTVDLVTNRYDDGNNLGTPGSCPNVLFTLQNGGAALSDVAASNVNGVFTPEQSLSLFNNGSNPNGTWTLRVCDEATGDDGDVRYVRLNLCSPPTVTYTQTDDCANGQFSISANVTNVGSGSSATIQYTVNGGPPVSITGLPAGPVSPALGPFNVGDIVVVTSNTGTAACSSSASTFSSSCPLLIDCDAPAVQASYCYGNNDSHSFTYTTTTENETVTVTFSSGTIGPNDVVTFYDGTDASGTILPNPPGNGFSNTSLAGLVVTSLSESIYIEVSSDGSGSCQNGQPGWNWNYEVECTAGCTDPDGTVTAITNCGAYNFTLDVEINDAGDNGSTILEYTVNGGAPQTYPTPLVTFDVVTIPTSGAFAIDDQVFVRLLHGGDAACDHVEGTFTDDNSCPSAENCLNALNLGTQTSPLPGTTVGRTNDFSIACGTASTNTAPDAIYYIDVPSGQTLNIRQSTNNYDSQHYVRFGGTCPGTTAIACIDDEGGQTAFVTWNNTTGSTQRVWWIQDGFGANSGTFTLEWTVAPPAIFPLGTCAQNYPIPDDGCDGGSYMNALFPISGQPNSMGTNVGLESVDLIITHTWRDDLHVSLVSPTGQEVLLIADRGGDWNNFGANGACTPFKLKDGGTPLANLPAANNGLGTWAPEQPLAGFTGNPNGTWTLRICDDTGLDTGSLRYLQLNFLPIDCNGVLGGTAMPGTACNDNNACTSGDVWSPTCVCAGTPLPDADGDGTCDTQDTCTDTDTDGFGDPGFPANTCTADNCPAISNADQANNDGDAQGDVCDDDDDDDGVLDVSDNCPFTANPLQVNTDGDSEGNACDADDDNDGVLDVNDNCSLLANADQANNDGDGEGDVCDTDDDNDGVLDVTDNCPLTANPDQANNDGDSAGDVCDADDDNDTVADIADNCPFAANTDQANNDGDTQGDACDPDDDNDGVLDIDDSCPFFPGVIGDICDANPGTGFTLGQINNSCTCAAAVCTIDLTLELSTDANGDDITWELRQQGTGTLVQSGGGSYPDNAQGVTDNTCLPNGNYYLRVIDAGGDGIVGGGYVLRTMGNPGIRIIDNKGNFSSGGVSAIMNNQGFNVPLGTTQMIYTSCDKMDWTTGQYTVCHPDAAVSAQFLTNPTNSGYEFWIYDPNGSYSFRKFRSHAVSDGFAPNNATRACHMKINNWAAANHVPIGALMNIKVRNRVIGVNGGWGPACRFKLDPVRAQCPLTKLMDIPGNEFLSCGGTRAWGTGNYIHARPVAGANKYQFRFRINGEPFVSIRTVNTYFVQLNWITSPLQDGVTYDVDVRASKDGGLTWCSDFIAPALDPWGDVCNLTIDNTPASGGNENIATSNNPALRMYPNPNRGDQLYLSLDAVEEGVTTVSVDIFDLTGKRISARTIAVNDGFVNTVLDLDGDMASGIYLVSITSGEQRYTERLVVEK